MRSFWGVLSVVLLAGAGELVLYYVVTLEQDAYLTPAVIQSFEDSAPLRDAVASEISKPPVPSGISIRSHPTRRTRHK
ncbi:MAG: hypothetical protein HY400_04370, partial [Elusimicrobia bacterium]|nr:hypothetical protein [Elusimicrobiota bacterium]